MDWSGIATAYLDRERARLGLPSREQEAATRMARDLAQRTGESNLATAAVGRQKTAAEIESMPIDASIKRAHLQALTDAANALASEREAGKPQPQGTLRPLVNSDGEVTGFYNEKTGEIKTNVPTGLRTKPAPAPKTPPRGTAIVRTMPDGSEVAFYPGTGESIPLPGGNKPTAQEQNRRAQAEIVHAAAQDILTKLTPGPNGTESEAASEMGPFVGRFVTPAKQLFGGAQAATDLQTSLRSFASLLPILHGFRGGTQLQAEFENMAGNIAQNPQTVAQRVKALSAVADKIRQGASETEIQAAIDAANGSPTAGAATSPAADPLEGRTATGPNGELVIRKGGAWVPQ